MCDLQSSDVWSEEELAVLEKQLVAEADEIRDKLAAVPQEAADLDHVTSSGQDDGDLGTILSEHEQELAVADHLRERLAQTERAVERIRHGDFGTCEHCGQPIPRERLETYPRATMCISCKQRDR